MLDPKLLRDSPDRVRAAIDGYLKDGGVGPKFVAGSIGPMNRTTSMSRDVDNPGARDVGVWRIRYVPAEKRDATLVHGQRAGDEIEQGALA